MGPSQTVRATPLSPDPPSNFFDGLARGSEGDDLVRAWRFRPGGPAVSVGSRPGPVGRVMGQTCRAGPARARSSSQAFCHGHAVGRCMVRRRAERASRAGTLMMSCARMVEVLARAWNGEARTPAARVRLKAIAAQTSQALLAQPFPEGRCASGPPFRSAMTCSMIACPRCALSAASIGRGLLVNTAWSR